MSNPAEAFIGFVTFIVFFVPAIFAWGMGFFDPFYIMRRNLRRHIRETISSPIFVKKLKRIIAHFSRKENDFYQNVKHIDKKTLEYFVYLKLHYSSFLKENKYVEDLFLKLIQKEESVVDFKKFKEDIELNIKKFYDDKR